VVVASQRRSGRGDQYLAAALIDERLRSSVT